MTASFWIPPGYGQASRNTESGESGGEKLFRSEFPAQYELLGIKDKIDPFVQK